MLNSMPAGIIAIQTDFKLKSEPGTNDTSADAFETDWGLPVDAE